MMAVRKLVEAEIGGRTYRKGEAAGFVEIERRLELPLPRLFFILQVIAGRESKVIEAYRRRDISAYSPRIVRFVDRRDGVEARAPHLGKTIVRPWLPGLVFIPDFDFGRVVKLDYVEDWLRLDSSRARPAALSPEDMRKVVLLEAALNLPLSERDAALMKLIRSFGGSTERKAALDQLVRIVSGKFAGLEGNVKRLDSGGRLKVFIAALMGGASVDVDEAQIEPVSQRAACATARRPKRKRRIPRA